MSLSAAVTRILTLSGFPPELKTRDIQAAFGEWENERGGFKIKWVDDTTLMLVFMDAVTAKRAYLSTLLEPPAQLVSGPNANRRIIIKPYDGLDAQAIIQNVNSRTNPTRGGHATRQSVSIASGGVPLSNGSHKRAASYANAAGSYGRASGLDVAAATANAANANREHSPTLPNLPTHPTLNALISSSLNDLTPPANSSEGAGYISGDGAAAAANGGAAPKVGDPGRRMVGHALGIRHPALTNNRAGVDGGVKEIEKSMAGVAITAE